MTAFEIRKVAVCGNCASVNDPWCDRCRGCNSAKDLITQFRCGCNDVLLPTADCPCCRAIKEAEARAAEAKRAAALVLEAKRAEATKAEEARASPSRSSWRPKRNYPRMTVWRPRLRLSSPNSRSVGRSDPATIIWSNIGITCTACTGVRFPTSATICCVWAWGSYSPQLALLAGLILVGIGFHVLTLINNVIKGNTSGEQVIDTILTDLKVVVAIFIRNK